MAVTRIKNNQITDSTITGAKIANTTLTGGLFATSLTLNSEVSIVGNLSVTGTTSTVSSTNTFINDPLVVYNNGYTGDLSNYSIGLLVNRNLASLAALGSVNVAWAWDEAQGAFVAIATTDTGSGITNINNSGYANVKVGYQEVTGKVTAAELNTTLEYVTNSLTTTLVATNFSSSNVDVNGGAIDGATIGATSATTGIFTTIDADGITATTGNAATWYATTLNSTAGNITTLTAPTIGAIATTTTTINATTGNVTGLTAGSATVSDLTNNRVVIAGTSGALEDDANFTFDGTDLNLTGGLNVTGDLAVDNIAINLNAITSTNTDGDITLTPNGTGEVVISAGLVTTLNAATATIPALNSTAGNITTLTSPTIDAQTTTSTTLNATTGNITTLTSPTIDAQTTTTTTLNATTGNITTLSASGTSTVAQVDATILNGATLNATAGNITTLTSPTIDAQTTTTTTLNATTGNVTTLTATNVINTTLVATNFSSSNVDVNGGAIDGATIGAASASTGAFTTLTASGNTTVTSSQGSGNASSGAVVVTGGVGIGENLNVGGDVIITGDLTVEGDTTTINTATLNVEDLNITIADGAADAASANGAGITVDGASATITYASADDSWNFNKLVKATTGSITTLTSTNVINTTLVATNFSSGNVDINGGTIDGTNIGVSSQGSGAFTTISASGTSTVAQVDATVLNSASLNTTAGNITTLTSPTIDAQTTTTTTLNATAGNITTLTSPTIDAQTTTSTTVNATTGNITTLTATDVINTTLVATNFSSSNVDVGGGAVDGTPIGAASASTGAFTTLSASGTSTVAQVDATILNSATVNATAGNITTLTSPTIDAQTTTSTTVNATTGNITTLTAPTIHGQTTTSTTINSTSGNITTLTGTTVNAQNTTSTGVNATNGNVTTLVATNFSSGNVDINGGAVDGTPIGAASASTGAFTSLDASGVSTLAGNIVGTSGTASTSDITGALVITGTGGAGIGGNINVGGGALLNTDQTANYDVKVYGANDTSLLWARSASGYDQVLIGNSASVSTLVTGAKLQINTTDSILIPSGTTAQRPGSVGGTNTAGMIRFNTSIANLEFYNGSEWTAAGSEFTVLASDTFDGDDSTTGFTLGAAATTAGVIASINGVVQLPTTAYSVSGTTLTFTEAPATGDKIEVRRIITTSTVAALESPNGYVQFEAADNGAKIYAGAGAATLRWTIDTDGHLVPAANSTQNIGSSSNRLGTLYVTDLVTGNQGDLRFNDADSSNFVAFQAPATVGSNITWTLPAEDASVSGYALVSDASGTLSWAAAGATIAQDEATNTNFNLYFASATSGALTAVNYDTGVHYNPSTGTVTSAAFAGAVTGAVTGDVTGQLTAQNIQVGVTGANEIDTTSGGLTIDSAGGTVTVDDNLIVSGDFTVNGTTTTINSTTLTVDDKNIVLASGAADAATADGAGITVDGASATITYANSGDKWVLNKATDVSSLLINGTAVSSTAAELNLVDTSVADTVVNSKAVIYSSAGNVRVASLNATGTVQAVHGNFSGNVTATYFVGTATESLYADLAENYQADANYSAATVLEFGGAQEVTTATEDSRRVAGIVSTNPAHLMNGGLTGSNVVALALMGRVPCLAIGPVVKGDMMVSAGFGYAKAHANPATGTVIGKALETLEDGVKATIEVVVGKV